MSVYVLFFGGYHATQTDVNAWLGSARALCPDVTYEAAAWPPGASADAHSAVTTFKKGGQWDWAMNAISSSNADEIYLVGHSSGCAIANAVDRGLDDHDKISLVALDGFAPDARQVARPSTQIWAAECGHTKSLNYHALRNAVGSRLQVYPANDCHTKWALHFSLVNAAATDKVVTTIKSGYNQCRANLDWLD